MLKWVLYGKFTIGTAVACHTPALAPCVKSALSPQGIRDTKGRAEAFAGETMPASAYRWCPPDWFRATEMDRTLECLCSWTPCSCWPSRSWSWRAENRYSIGKRNRAALTRQAKDLRRRSMGKHSAILVGGVRGERLNCDLPGSSGDAVLQALPTSSCVQHI